MVTGSAIVADIAGLVGLFTATASLDVVAVFDSQSFAQLFPDARPVKAAVRPTSRTMSHPLEDSTEIADHRIINPLEIDMQLIVSSDFYSSTYNQIKQLFTNATLLTVQTKTGVYQNMFIADMPHFEDADMYDTITTGIHFKEILLQSANASNAFVPPNTDPDFASNINNGQVSSTTPFTGGGGTFNGNGATGDFSGNVSGPVTPLQTGSALQQHGATGAW